LKQSDHEQSDEQCNPDFTLRKPQGSCVKEGACETEMEKTKYREIDRLEQLAHGMGKR
jgi:hypothetical protein